MLNLQEFLDSEDIYTTVFPAGWSFSYRLLTLDEYRKFYALRANQTVHPFFIYRSVFERCFLGDVKLITVDLPAGVTVSLGLLIMWLSGDCNEQTLVADIQSIQTSFNKNDVFEVMKRIIVTAFPTYDVTQLRKLNRNQFLRLFVEAETIMEYKHGEKYIPLDLTQITSVNSPAVIDEQSEDIFRVDSAAMNNPAPVSILAQDDIAEHEYKVKKLTRDQLKKVDTMKNKL